MKNVVKLDNYYYPWELSKALADWVDHYTHERYHESLDKVMPGDVYGGKKKRHSVSVGGCEIRTMIWWKVHNLRFAD